MSQRWIVVYDPFQEFFEGSLIEEVRYLQLKARGVVSLPVLPELFKYSGVGGYSKRAWGAGWPLDQMHPKLTCPLTLFIPQMAVQRNPTVHWAARLAAGAVELENVRAGKTFEGQLHFAPDPSQHTPYKAGMVSAFAPTQMSKLGMPDDEGGWTLEGKAAISVQDNGHYGFGLYGFAPGLRVLWVAASVTAKE